MLTCAPAGKWNVMQFLRPSDAHPLAHEVSVVVVGDPLVAFAAIEVHANENVEGVDVQRDRVRAAPTMS